MTAGIAIRYGDGRWPGLVAEKLFDSTFVPTYSPLLGLHDVAAAQALTHPLPRLGRNVRSDTWASWQKLANVSGLDVSAGLVFSDETHAISAAIGGQGVALMSRQLIGDELREGRLVQPFGPMMEGKPFHLVYPEGRRDDPTVLAVRDWVMGVPGGLCEAQD